VRDQDGDSQEYTATVSISNLAPTATFRASPALVAPGEAVTLSFTDPHDVAADVATLQYAFNCGDGGGYGGTGPNAAATCTATAPGTLTVKGKVLDKDGDETEYTASVEIVAANYAAAGANVQVTPLDPATNAPGPVKITFTQVTGGGTVNIASGTPGNGGTPRPESANFRLGGGGQPTYYDVTLSTSLQFTGTALVCVTYPVGQFTNTDNLRLLHYSGGAWEVLPNQSVNAATRTVCATTAAFSPFMIAELELAPVVTKVVLAGAPVPVNNNTTLQATFTDANVGDMHTASFAWGSNPVAGTIVETSGAGTLTRTQAFAEPGVYTITASVSDGDRSGSRSSANDTPAYLVVYDPSAGFVTGGGWLLSAPGACRVASVCSAAASGKANFGFVAKYNKKNTALLEGSSEFQFQAGGLLFQSAAYDWLVVNQSGTNAQFKGVGAINGAGAYRFMIWAGDGTGAGGSDTFRIRIWTEAGGVETTIYDNGTDQVIGGGSIVVHTK
jgi:hypothetical protein